jgi:hypothetical protein
MKRMKPLVDMVSEYVKEYVPDMAIEAITVDISLKCTKCGGRIGAENPTGAAELRCWWCHKEARKR